MFILRLGGLGLIISVITLVRHGFKMAFKVIILQCLYEPPPFSSPIALLIMSSTLIINAKYNIIIII